MGVKRVKIGKQAEGMTLLEFVKTLSASSSQEIKSALDLGAARVNGKCERFSTLTLNQGDRVEIDLDFKERVAANKVRAPTILYEDEHLLVINKGSALACDSESVTPFFTFPIFLVHRLDKRTTGALCLAKTKKAKEGMEQLFKKRSVSKTYLAISCGSFKKSKGSIETHLKADTRFAGQTLYKSVRNSSYTNAKTYYQVAPSKKKGFTPVWCQIETGKTHQIRVHLKEAGHPIVGDLLYGRSARFPLETKHMLLHAYKLSFIHPITGEKLEVKAPLPSYFKPFL